MAGMIQPKFQVHAYATFNTARCDRKERLDTNERDRERKKKRTVAEGDKHEKRKTKERMNGERRQIKIPL